MDAQERVRWQAVATDVAKMGRILHEAAAGLDDLVVLMDDMLKADKEKDTPK